MTKLLCPECRHENEPERVYCHSCGARLDRSALAKAKSKEEDPKATRKRLKSMLDPRGAKLRMRFFQLSKLVLGALALAVLIQMLLPPDVPPRPKSTMLAAQIGLDLENAAASHSSTPIQYTSDQVNTYLAYTLKSKQAALSNFLQFERALVAFDEGSVRVTTERSLFGYSVYVAASYGVALRDGHLVARNLGGSIGRLPIHPQLMQHGDVFFSGLWAALDRERKSVAKMAGIELHPQVVALTPRA
ncbi:MAG: zinc ribbon domain-containing protein [Chthoniobacterales bacterium]